jgi:predicted glycoside hydrolase/deacetylase ChbG (UPF0249 family)
MLIINADDFGRSPGETDAALTCHKAGRLTSVSAMVFMEDSERAAKLARGHGIDAGLHINFSQSFSGNARAIPGAAQAHSRIIRFLRSSKYALLLYHPFLVKQFRHVFEAQLDEFVRLYGRRPSHYDGHQHLHLCTNMLLGRVLPAGERVRRSFSFSPGEKSAINRAYRRWVDHRLAARHRLTDYFFSLSQQLQSGKLARVLQLAQSATVELMAHPEWPREHAFLMGKEFDTLLPQLRVQPAASPQHQAGSASPALAAPRPAHQPTL